MAAVQGRIQLLRRPSPQAVRGEGVGGTWAEQRIDDWGPQELQGVGRRRDRQQTDLRVRRSSLQQGGESCKHDPIGETLSCVCTVRKRRDERTEADKPPLHCAIVLWSYTRHGDVPMFHALASASFPIRSAQARHAKGPKKKKH
jgi:hypothetical protein